MRQQEREFVASREKQIPIINDALSPYRPLKCVD